MFDVYSDGPAMVWTMAKRFNLKHALIDLIVSSNNRHVSVKKRLVVNNCSLMPVGQLGRFQAQTKFGTFEESEARYLGKSGVSV